MGKSGKNYKEQSIRRERERNRKRDRDNVRQKNRSDEYRRKAA